MRQSGTCSVEKSSGSRMWNGLRVEGVIENQEDKAEITLRKEEALVKEVAIEMEKMGWISGAANETYN